MTRINLVPPKELCDQHLLAEWRELTRIPNGIASGKYVVRLSEIPARYTVRTENNPSGGQGHVKFFFNKLWFLLKRYEDIMLEMKRRGLRCISMWPMGDHVWPLQDPGYWNDYTPTPEALALNRQRIAERMPKQPRYSGETK